MAHSLHLPLLLVLIGSGLWIGGSVVGAESTVADRIRATRGNQLDVEVPPGDSRVEVLFELRNQGATPVECAGIQKSCGCIQATLTPPVIPAGGSSELALDVALARLDRAQDSGTVRLTWPDRSVSSFQFRIARKRVLMLSLDPATIDERALRSDERPAVAFVADYYPSRPPAEASFEIQVDGQRARIDGLRPAGSHAVSGQLVLAGMRLTPGDVTVQASALPPARLRIRSVEGVDPTGASRRPDGAPSDPSATLAVLRSVCEEVSLLIEQNLLVKSRAVSRQLIRFDKREHREALAWWSKRDPAAAPPTAPERLDTSDLPERTLLFDGLRQVDWFCVRAGKEGEQGRAWLAQTAAAPTLPEERIGYLRLLGRGRLGNWLWEDCPDGRAMFLSMLGADLLLVGNPVGDPEHLAGAYAYDLVYIDPATRLPARIVEHMPSILAPEEVNETALAGLEFAEIRVTERHANGLPRRVEHDHRSEDLLDFRWISHETDLAEARVRSMLADSSACPVAGSELPVRRSDALYALAEDAAQDRSFTPLDRAARSRPDIARIGIILAAVGVLLSLGRRVLRTRPASPSPRAS